jgi:hypothetical protein
MFPNIEQRQEEDEMSPSPADFSEILELQQYRRLYEEQEEKNKIQLAERSQQLERLRAELAEKSRELEELGARSRDSLAQNEKLRHDYARLKLEAQQKIDKLMERIKELNQRIAG